MEKGLVSIITPIYNGARYVSETIQSVLNQSFSNWEMIIIDDGSIDNSCEIIDRFIHKEPKIRLFSQKNAGSASARNNGIKRARGQFICLLDADDVWEPEFLTSQLRFMHVNSAVLVCSSHRRINENSIEILKPFIAPFKASYSDLLKTCSISCLTGVYDIEPYGKVYLKEEFKSLRDDYIYWLEIIKKIKFVYGNPDILASYRMLDNSATRKKSKLIIPQFKVFYSVEKLGILRSIYYLASWATFGFLKYRK